jgi:hypothetical protein
MPLNKDLREFIALLNSNRVEFLVVGAYAVAFHGYPRYTGDLDILIKPNRENALRVQEALAQFGFGGLGIRIQDLEVPGPALSEPEPNRSGDVHHWRHF